MIGDISGGDQTERREIRVEVGHEVGVPRLKRSIGTGDVINRAFYLYCWIQRLAAGTVQLLPEPLIGTRRALHPALADSVCDYTTTLAHGNKSPARWVQLILYK